MVIFSLILSFGLFLYACEAGVTEIPPDSSGGEAVIETITDETWMPSNIFDVKANGDARTNTNQQENDIQNDSTDTTPWDADSSQIFRAIRDFIFQASDDILETEERNEDPTEEIVKIIEKGLIEATTMFLTPHEEQISTTSATSEDPQSEISIVKIENVSPDSMLDRIGLNIMELPNSRQTISISNTTTACSDCYNSLQTCVQICFTKHNCNDVQRQARVCPPSAARLCNIFTQWGPVDECRSHEDCSSPLLCCSDGCINKCSPGVWRN